MVLAFPITHTQIDAANRIYGRLTEWQSIDRTLTELSKSLPGYGFEAVLVKACVVNQLYSTNLYRVVAMAKHIVTILDGKSLAELQVSRLVEDLGTLLPTPEHPHPVKAYSFASKFAHFFVDPERFPIFDSYARKMVTYHVGSKGLIKDVNYPYQVFVQNLSRLNKESGVNTSMAELDRYLWLSGIYREVLKTKGTALINAEVKRLLEFGIPEVLTDFEILLSGKG